jgi:periplasmic protein TonB
MRSLSTRSSDAASSWMLATSACIHGICILAIVVFSGSFHKPQSPPAEIVTRVKLVEPAPGPPVLDKVLLGIPQETGSPRPEEAVQLTEPVESPARTPAMVAGKTAEIPAESIKVVKRKKPMRHVKAPKPPEKPPEKAPPEPAKKKENPDEFLAKRIADLRKGIETKKSDAVDPRPTPKTERSPVAGAGATQGSGAIDKELLQWFSAVRTRINARWSVFASYRHLDRVTVVGVHIADDGRLLDATIDESSGDEVLDRSAMRAVAQASPFPPVPAEVAERIRTAGGLALRFTVKGMQ